MSFFWLLSALLFNEVKYVETLVDLQNIENMLKGRSNMVFAYVPATGTAGINTELLIFGLLPEFFLPKWKGTESLTQNPANGGSRKPERAA